MTSSQHSPDETPPDAIDLTGLDVYYNSRDLGAIEEVLEHSGRRYLVIDTRHWTFGHRRIVPAELVGTDVDRHAGRRIVTSHGADPSHIRDAPDFDPFRLDDADYWAAIDRHYEFAAPTPPHDNQRTTVREPIESPEAKAAARQHPNNRRSSS